MDKQPDESSQVTSRPDPFELYNERATQNDRNFVKECYESMDTMLVFAGIFSAAIAQFLSSTSNLLSNTEKTNQLLNAILNVHLNQPYAVAEDFTPSASAVVVNSLFFISLILSLLAALAAMLVKQYVRHYELENKSGERLTWRQARQREVRRRAVEEWHLQSLISFIPTLIHIALALFFAGVIVWISILGGRALNAIFIPSMAFIGFGGIIYIVLTILPTITRDTPFHGPASSGIIATTSFLKRNTRRGKQRTNSEPKNPANISVGSPRRPPFAKWVDSIRGWLGQSMLVGDHGNASSSARATVDIPTAGNNGDVQAEAEDDYTADDFPKLTFSLSPRKTSYQHSEQAVPKVYEQVDAYVLAKVFRQTRAMVDMEAVMDTLLDANWDNVDMAPVLLADGDAILERCADLADTCWVDMSGGMVLKRDHRERASRVCYFIEWFYHHISPEQRHLLRQWPSPNVALALDFGNESYKPSIEDKVVAASVISKLNHVKLPSGESCRVCFTNTVDQVNDLYALIYNRPRITQTPFNFLEMRAEAREVQALITACCSSRIDCLFNYIGETSSSELQAALKISEDTWRPVIIRWGSSDLNQNNFIRLRRLIWTAKEWWLSPSDDLRGDWLANLFTAAGPV